MTTSVRRALALSLVERYLLLALSLASNMILARLLTPEQIGIYSVSLAVIGIVQVLRDFGIGNFLIQEKNLTDDHIRTAFGISLLVGGALFPIVFFGAPWAAKFYGDERMISTLRITSMNFLLLPFCAISLALMRREMQFQRLLYVTLGASVVGFVVTLGCAWRGLGEDSMAWGAVAMNAATGLGAWLARRDARVLTPSLRSWRVMLHWGAQSSAASVVTSVAMDINDLALGKLLGFAPVAVFSRAQGLISMVQRDLMSAVRNVAFPAFAKVHREGGAADAQHTHAVGIITVTTWTFYGFVALFGLETMRLMFGTQWDEAAALLPIFCLGAAISAPTYLVTSVMMAVGRMDMVAASELVFQPLRAILVVLVVYLLRSIEAAAWVFVVVSLLYLPGIYLFKRRCVGTDMPALLAALSRSAMVVACALAVPLWLSMSAGLGRQEPASAATFAVAIVATIVCWLAALVLLRHPLAQEPMFRALLARVPCMRRWA